MNNNDTIFSEIKPPEIEVGPGQGLLTRLIDTLIDLLILLLIYFLVPRDILYDAVSSSRLVIPATLFAVIVIYRITFLLLFNKTVGMMICKVKLLNKELLPLSPKQKLLSIFRTRFSAIKFYKDQSPLA